MSSLQQTIAVTITTLSALPQRRSASLVVVVGIAAVVAVLVSVLAMSTGIARTMQRSGREDRVLVMRNGSTSEVSSALTRSNAQTILASSLIQRHADGTPIASAELLRFISLSKKADGSEVYVTIRGIGAQGMSVRPEMKLIAGRMFRPALNEIIVGRAAKSLYADLELGDQVRMRNVVWTVVGTFATGGDSHESEIVTDAATLMSAAKRNSFSSVALLLDSPESFGKFKDELSSNPALAVDVVTESEYLAQQSKATSQILSLVAYVVGGIMAIGAVLGALNTMYSAVSARTREIATLRAIGFGSMPIITSVLVESLLLATAGGLLGGAAAWIFVDGNLASTRGGGAQGQLVFDLIVSGQLIVVGMVWAGIIGLIGGLLPAIRAARLPIAAAIRAI